MFEEQQNVLSLEDKIKRLLEAYTELKNKYETLNNELKSKIEENENLRIEKQKVESKLSEFENKTNTANSMLDDILQKVNSI